MKMENRTKQNSKERKMKTMNKKYFTILTLLATVAIVTIYCVFFQAEKTKILKEFYPSKKIKAEYEYILKDGDTVLQGEFLLYNPNGIVIAKGTNLNNEPYGKTSYYYGDGKLESVFFRKNSKISEESFEYYPNGEIKRYIMYDPFGLEAFIATYDEAGELKNYAGFPIMEIYQYKFQHKKKFNIQKDQFLKTGDTLIHKYLIANIPKSKREFFLESISEDTKPIIIKNVSTVQTDYREVLTKKGKNYVKSIVTYKFKNKENTFIADTISFSVNVH